jgi:hypothetical protein
MLFFSSNKRVIFTFGFSFFFAFVAQAQVFSGQVIDPDKKSLPYTGLTLKRDSVKIAGGFTDSFGKFVFRRLTSGNYTLQVKSLLYEAETISFYLDSAQRLNRVVQLSNKIDNIKGAAVIGRKDAITQKNDTIEYTSSNYKVNKDATAENLITKMPGITNENGVIKAQGEEVKKVTVDGQDFFGDDASAALKNLPAEVVDKVQVYDRMSDQSQFSGINDGNSSKTLNIITKAGKNNGQFGKIYGGYGTDNRWAAGANINVFKGKQRLSLIGMSNNINQQNFSSTDILGLTGNTNMGGGRGGMGGGGMGSWGGGNNNFTVNNQSGINTTNAIGVNYSLYGGKKYKLTASYFFNTGKNTTSSFLNRTYFLSALRNQLYSQGDTGTTNNSNHKFNARFEYNLDTNNSIIFTPQFSLQGNKSNTLFLGKTASQEAVNMNLSNSKTISNTSGYNFNQSLLLRHKFKKAGQTISLNINTSNSKNSGGTLLESGNYYYELDTISNVFRQNSDRNNNTFSFSPNLSYTHPIKKRSVIELTYNPSLNYNKSSKLTKRLDVFGVPYYTDSLLSNTFDNNTSTQKAGMTYRYNYKKVSFNIGADAQSVKLNGAQTFPFDSAFYQPFNNILPNAMFTYAASKSSNLRLFYRSSTNLPSISQLQNVVNNSNPLILSAGNANLVQEFRNMIHLRYSKSNVAKGRTMFIYSNLTTASNYIGNSTTLAIKDTIISGVALKKGAQLSLPVNLNGYKSFRAYLSYGMPMKKIKSTFNLNLGQTYSSTPALINGNTNFSNNFNSNIGLVLASNISESLDFTLNYTLNYTTVQNTLQSSLNNQYVIQNFNAKINFMPTPKWVFNADITNSSYKGLGATFNQNIWLCNAGFGYKFLKDNRGELKLSVFDALKQNTSIARTVSESYIEDKNTQILTRFYMLTFTYSIRHFKVKPAPKDAGKNKK